MQSTKNKTVQEKRLRLNMGYVYIAATVLLTVYGQIVVKWQVAQYGALPADTNGKIGFILQLLLNPWIISVFIAAFLASMSWMAAMTQFTLSFAYPFTSISFILVTVLSVVLLHEPFAWNKMLGALIIIAGLFVATR